MVSVCVFVLVRQCISSYLCDSGGGYEVNWLLWINRAVSYSIALLSAELKQDMNEIQGNKIELFVYYEYNIA